MRIDKKYFFFSKSDSKRAVFFGISIYLSTFNTVFITLMQAGKNKRGYYKFEGWGLGIALTLFEIEFVITLVPFITKVYDIVDGKLTDLPNGK